MGRYVVVNGAIEESYVGEDCNGEYYNMNKSYDDPCEINEQVGYYEWLADSGMTLHITHRCDAFSQYMPIPLIPIAGVGGKRAHAIGRGTIHLHSKCDGYLHTLQLNNVLHMPTNKNNLFSLGSWEEVGRRFYGRFGKLLLITNEGTAIARGNKVTNKLYKMKFTLAPPTQSEFTFVTSTSVPTWETWHRRYGHVSYSRLWKLLDLGLVDRFEINVHSPKPDCMPCTEAKLSKAPYGPATIRETDPGQLTHIDLWGKYNTASINGNRYYLLMVDDATCHTTVEFLKNKSKAAQKVIEYMTHLKMWNKTPHAIQMDRGSEFVKDELISWCDANGIELQLTAPYLPSQNGVTEWMNRTLVELACAMLTDSKLPLFLWELAVAHAAYLRNLSFTSAKPGATPYQGWTGKKPNVSHLRKFSAPIWVLLQGQSIQKKMLPKSQCHAYVGYDDGSKAIKYYNAATKNILLSRNFRFLTLSEPTPPEDIIIENPPEDQGENSPPCKGEADSSTRSRAKNQTTIPQK